MTTGTGYPSYDATSYWERSGAAYRVWVTLSQTQTEPQSNTDVFVMPVEIGVKMKIGTPPVDSMLVQVVQNNQRSQVFQLDVPARPETVLVDPNKHILRGEAIHRGPTRVPSGLNITAVAPNPARGPFVIHYLLDRPSHVDIDVFDVRGARVMSRSVASDIVGSGVQLEPFDASSLPSGVYFVRLRSARGEAARKFVVIH